MSVMTKSALCAAIFGVALAAAPVSSRAADISGAGATFPYPVYAKWADAYRQATGVGLNYQSIGSGGGIKQIKAGTVTFGASDMPLPQQELQQAGLVQFPMIMGGVVPVVNLRGIQPGQIKLDGPTLAKMYMGEIKRWNAAEITALNPGVTLPNTAIAPVYRSDGSGTNFLFTDYLSKVSPAFKEQIGAATSVQWPAGIGGKGNEGVANMTRQTEGAIGYVEYAYAKQNNIAYIALKNHDGQFVEPKLETFQAAAAGADWANAPGFNVVLTDEPGAQAWPITGASFILIHQEPRDPQTTEAALKFFDWAYKNGDQMAQQLDYVPIPDQVVSLVQKRWQEQIKADGRALWSASAE